MRRKAEFYDVLDFFEDYLTEYTEKKVSVYLLFKHAVSHQQLQNFH